MSPVDEYAVYCDLAWADLADRLKLMREASQSLQEALYGFMGPTVPAGYSGPQEDVQGWLAASLDEHEQHQLPVEVGAPRTIDGTPDVTTIEPPSTPTAEAVNWWF